MNQIFEKNFIPTIEAAKLSGYTSDYLARLARSGKISAKRVGHTWLVDTESLKLFLDQQGDRKIDYARALARAREEEYRTRNSPLQHATNTLTKPLQMPEKLGVAVNAFRTHALAVSLSLAVVVSGAVVARAEAIPFVADKISEIVGEVNFGFKETFGDIPSRIVTRIEKAESDMRSVSPALKVAEASVSNPFTNFDLSSLHLQMAVAESEHEPRNVSSKKTFSFSTEPITFESLQSSAFDIYNFVTEPSLVYQTIGTNIYDATISSLSYYRSLIENSGTETLSLASHTRDAVATAPRIVSEINLAFGNAIISATHSAVYAEMKLVYGLAEMAPKSARAAVSFAGGIGNTLAGATELAVIRMPAKIALVLRSFSEAGPAIASAVFNAEYGVSARFVKDTQAISNSYLKAVNTTGRLYSDSSLALRNLGEDGPSTIQDAYLATLGKSALALDTFAKVPKVAAVISTANAVTAPLLASVQPAMNAGEKVALATYKTFRGLFNSASRAFAVLLGPPPSIVLPDGAPRTRVLAVSKPPASSLQPPANSYPTYNTNTIVQGVSQDFVNQSLASLRADILATASGMIKPVYMQTVTNAATIQSVNRIEDLSNLIVRNGDFRGGVFDNGERVSAKTGTFTNLNGGATSIAGTTITGDLSVSGTITPSIISASTSISAPYFTATSTTATSTFAGVLAIGTTTPFHNGLFTVGTSTPLLYIERNSGRIGLGTSTPLYTLDIAGTLNASGATTLGGTVTANATSTATYFSASTLGTVGAPAYTFSSDLTTGFWSPLTSTLALSTGGAERLRVDSSGNIGIATTSPYAKLSVVGQIAASHFTATTSTASTFPYASTTMLTAVTASTTDLIASAFVTFQNLIGMLSSNGTSGTSARTLTGTANQITITNGDGTAGNPTFSLPSLVSLTNASTSQLSVFQRAYFGGTSTTTIDSAGSITLPTVALLTAPYASTTMLTATTASTTNLTVSSLTPNRVPYITTANAFTDSANLTFDGTTLTPANLTVTTNTTLSNLTASRLVATDGSKILVSTITAGNLLSSVTGTTGTAGNLVFSTSPTISDPTLTGLSSINFASSTLFSANQAYFGTTATSTFSTNGSLTLPTVALLTAPYASTTMVTATTASTTNLIASAAVTFQNLLGILSSNGTSGVSARTLTGTANQITIANGDGTGGNPTFSLPSLLAFTNASTSQLSVTNQAWFGGTATSTFDSAGALTLITPLLVASGGTGQNTFSSSQLLYGAGTGAVQSVATSSLAVGTGLASSGTLGAQVGGTASTISFAAIAANSLWANNTGASAVPTAIATSSLFTWTGTGDVVRATSPTLATPTITGLATMASASTTLFSSYGPAYFGATATSTFDSAGNLAVGGTLTVAGLCVTGDTRLRRRRKARKGEEDEEDEDGYIYDEVAIKDVKEGDEIQSLDEKTGKLVWSKVKQLAYMGKKQTFKLTLASGKTIRTTANHPYLARRAAIHSAHGKATGHARGLSRVGVFIDSSNLYHAAKKAEWQIGLKNLKELLSKSANLVSACCYIAMPREGDPTREGMETYVEVASRFFSVSQKPLKYIFDTEMRKNIKKGDVDLDIAMDVVRALPSLDAVVIMSGDSDYLPLAKYAAEVGVPVVFMSYKESMAWELRLGNHLFIEHIRRSIDRATINPDLSAGAALTKSIIQKAISESSTVQEGVDNHTSPEATKGTALVRSGEGSWSKVSELKEGMEIAVAATAELGTWNLERGSSKHHRPSSKLHDISSVVWERIVSVEPVAEEDVYDIEVEGTHNFIGNDIVAHNTALFNHASSTLFSNTGTAYFGATATSTFSSAGALTLITPLLVGSGGTGASTLTGLLQGNGTSAITGITNSSTVGQLLRVTGASTYAWGALDLADTDAVTGDLPFANLTQVSANSVLGNITGATGDATSIATSSLFTWSGTGDVVRTTSPTLITPALGTPSALVLTNATGLPVGGGGTGLSSVGDGQLLFGSGGTTALTALATTSLAGRFLSLDYSTGRPSWVATSSLNVALSNTTGTLPVNRGGTNQTTFGGTNTLLYTTTADNLSSIANTTNGYVLALSSGVPTWVATSSINNGVSSISQTYGTAQTGAITLATSTTAISNDWGITNIAGAFTFNLPTATAAIRGLLSGTDWTTFNAKQAAGSYITALTGDVTASGPGSVAATIGANKVTLGMLATLAANSIIGNITGSAATPTAIATSSLFTWTGTGDVVRSTSPTLVTPTLGVASATSINKLTLTTPATSATLTILDGKTLTANNSLTLAGTDATTLTFQGTDTYVGRATTDTFTNKTFNTAGTGNIFQINGTGITAVTGTGSVVLATSPTIATPTFTGLSALAFASSTLFSANQAWFGATATSSFSSAGVLTLATDLAVTEGGTGASTFTANGVLYGNTANAIQVTAQGGANSILVANSGAPSFTSSPTIGGDVTINGGLTVLGALSPGIASTTNLSANQAWFGATATSTFSSAGALTLITPLLVNSGGTGATTFSSSQLLYGAGTGAVQSVATSSLAVGTGLTNSGTLGAQVGGANASISFAAISANSLWANNTGASAVPTNIATSSLFTWSGTGDVVRTTSPTLVTPTLGVASATSINKLTLTTPATSATLTIMDGKTLTINKTISFTSADDTGVYTLPTGTKTLVATDVTTLSSLASVGTITTGVWNGTDIAVADGGTGASTLTGLLQGNGASAITGITGTEGQFPYYNGTNTLLATSTVFLSTAGNIGIGTSSPQSRLAVSGGLSVGADYNIAAPTNGAIIQGNVGIGTTGPGSQLTVYGSKSAGGTNVAAQSPTDAAGNYASLQSLNSAGRAVYLTMAEASAGTAYYYHAGDATLAATANAKLHLRAGATDTGLTIDTAGNVGIGTTGPNEKLEVYGDTHELKLTFPTASSYGGLTFNEGTSEKGYVSLIGSTFGTADRQNNLEISTVNTTGGAIDLRPRDASAVRITTTGNVGIGTTTPSDKLEVRGADNGITIDTALGSRAKLTFKYNGTTNGVIGINGNNDLRLSGGGTIADDVVIDSTGNVGIGTTAPDSIKLDVEDDIEIGTGTTGCVRDADNTTLVGTCVSDERLKKNIVGFSAGTLDKLAQLRPVTFEWRNDEFDWLNGQEGVNYGLIAQEVEAVFPEMIHTDDRGYKRVSYDIGLSMRMLEGIRELDARTRQILGAEGVLSVVPGVESQCVTGDTKLRRRRRRSDGSYEFDEVEIKNVVAGDEIQSLDERTGSVVYSRVNALVDMGTQEVYELITKSGRRIRTTSNHPFLARMKAETV